MIKKYRRTQMIIVALVVVMFGVSVGFAAFSNVLTIGSSASVKPDSSTFSVLFSSSETSQTTSAISAVGINGGTGSVATISGTKISGLNANFTKTGQSVTYTFYAHNAGFYDAYLENIVFGSTKSCVAGTDTSTDLVSAACEDISISVAVGNTVAYSDKVVVDHILTKDSYEKVVVTITYASNGDVADGDFSVTFNDVSLTYSSVDSNLITFSINGISYNAVKGMTFLEFGMSEYNTTNLPMASSCDALMYLTYNVYGEDYQIEDGMSYTSTEC